MKAAVCPKYGKPEVLIVKHIDKPIPKANQILLKIHASSVSSGDARMRRADPFIMRFIFGCSGPRKSVLGVVVAGEVVAIGVNVSKFKVGDKIYGTTGMTFGAHAQFQTLSEDATLAIIPKNITYDEAAAIPFGATAAQHFLSKAKVKKDQKVLIYGASSAMGSIAIQLAKVKGAEVTAVCSAANHQLVLGLGADKVIDYNQTNFWENGEQYDVIFETVGKSSFGKGMRALKKDGTILLASASIGLMIRSAFTGLFSTKKVISGVIKETAEDMRYFSQLIEAGELKPVIDSVYTLDEISLAHTRVDGGRKKGNVIIQMNHIA